MYLATFAGKGKEDQKICSGEEVAQPEGCTAVGSFDLVTNHLFKLDMDFLQKGE
jgi:hypothetical protein